jgi:uncharacterized protein YndB with AHSA1/START domain
MSDIETRLQITRIFTASPEAVFDHWLDVESLKQWMCAPGMTVAEVQVDARVGGQFRFDMRADDGQIHQHTGEYLEIKRPERLVFSWQSALAGEDGSRVTVEFEPHPEGCRLVLTHERLPDMAAVQQHAMGWEGILANLSDSVE